jgi:hypothetical protein
LEILNSPGQFFSKIPFRGLRWCFWRWENIESAFGSFPDSWQLSLRLTGPIRRLFEDIELKKDAPEIWEEIRQLRIPVGGNSKILTDFRLIFDC